MINLQAFFASIGVVTPLYSFNNQYDFYRAVLWDDGTITHSQYEFYTKIADSRYEFFKQYINETEFYKDINDVGIWDFKTFYEVSQSYFANTVNTPIPCSSPVAVPANVDVNVEDYPLLWIEGDYIDTYTGDTFQVPQCVTDGNGFEYGNVTDIDLDNTGLTTDFTTVLLSKYSNLDYLDISFNNVSVVDVTNNGVLTTFHCHSNLIQDLDVTHNPVLVDLKCDRNLLTDLNLSYNPLLVKLILYTNQLTNLDISYNPLLNYIICAGNQLVNLDISNNPLLNYINSYGNQLSNIVNSQMLIVLDNHGLSNGYFNSSIFGGGSLTAAGATAKANLQAKGWTIVGV